MSCGRLRRRRLRRRRKRRRRLLKLTLSISWRRKMTTNMIVAWKININRKSGWRV
jgi:hypothetical protein